MHVFSGIDHIHEAISLFGDNFFEKRRKIIFDRFAGSTDFLGEGDLAGCRSLRSAYNMQDL